MCLIIYRPGGVVLDEKDFETAVMNNPDGWGMCTPDSDGTLYTIRDVPEKDTDAEELYRMLHEDFKDDPVMVHLRYTTAGDTILRNAHPFPILEKDRDGLDMRMCHNGTLWDFSPGAKDPNSWESDTRVFTRTVVRPLAQRFARSGMVDVNKLIDDPLFHWILDEALTTKSVLTFMDGNGEFRALNAKGNGGDWNEEGCYFSNDYSFNPTHRSYSYHSTGETTTTSTTSTQTTTTNTNKTHTAGKDYDPKMADTLRTKFTTEWGEFFEIHTLDEILGVSDDTIDLIASDEDPSKSFIMQLLEETQQLMTNLTMSRNACKKEEEGRKRAEMDAYNLKQRCENQTAWIVKAKKEGVIGDASKAA